MQENQVKKGSKSGCVGAYVQWPTLAEMWALAAATQDAGSRQV